ncbi:MAG: NAD-dependent epimerase/dehydratase family protein [Luteibacter sp.]|uniref:NAD-dependent epimerase/dehydratase family protein n=1 Tax=Luteibacter sp. TaxID=1886636 RepID=UPI002809ABFD|nr:NAD-dependent epimerase/dehydratase family protein [Luteibacter sp.]MDQ7996710.1 NAD(P)H-binding protein [Luteibacter sp.]MDQ8049705.1 NAD(P)H-binding protein [Luteibacter sp.]
MTQHPHTALVLGATGGVGGETARALIAAGWNVNALTRHTGKTGDGIRWIEGDAMVAADVLRAADGAQVIVHAVNPPGYKDWERVVLPMIDNTIAAAHAVGARIVLPGSVYNYGPDVYPMIAEDAAQHPPSRKGEIRVDVERHLQRAARDGVRSLVLRCGDFYGPGGGNNWLAQGIVTPGKPLRAIRYPGPPALRHAWAYLPDVASTLVALLDREDELETFARFHFGGHTLTGDELHAAIRRASGQPSLPMRPFAWWMVNLIAPFHETMREVHKMRYLWNEEVLMDGKRLRAFLPGHRDTPPDVAMKVTLDALGVLTR